MVGVEVVQGVSLKSPPLNFSKFQFVEKITESQSGPPRIFLSIRIWESGNFPNFVVAPTKMISVIL